VGGWCVALFYVRTNLCWLEHVYAWLVLMVGLFPFLVCL